LVVTGSFTSQGIDDNANATAITIDSSENVLVGGTGTAPDTSSTDTGHAFRADGRAGISRDGGPALSINRLNSDGNIAEFRKDGTTVGSIGSLSGGNLYIGTPAGNDSYLLFADNQVSPATSTGAARDAAIDLGNSTRRFKDAYLSGGVYLGGVGSANKLDDYEEGTWTPTTTTSGYTISSSSGVYTKIGRLVTIHFKVTFSSVGATASSLAILGQPFASVGNTIHQAGVGREASNTGAIYVCQVNHTNNSMGLNSMDGVSGSQNRTFRVSEDYVFTATYTTA